MKRIAAIYVVLLVVSGAASWDAGLSSVLRAWLGVTVLVVLLGAWWIFAIEAYRPRIAARDELGRHLHTGDPVAIPEPIELPDGVVVPGAGWRVQRIIDPRIRVADERGTTSGWIGWDALYVKQGRQRLPLEDPSPNDEVFAKRWLNGSSGRLAANSPLVVIDVKPVEVALADTRGERIEVPASRLRRV